MCVSDAPARVQRQNVDFCTGTASKLRTRMCTFVPVTHVQCFTAGGCAGVVPYLDHRQRDRLLQQRVASVLVLLYQQLRQYLCFCTSSCVSFCAFVLFVLANLEEDVDVVWRAARVRGKPHVRRIPRAAAPQVSYLYFCTSKASKLSA
jgi:hypothetical protein